MSGRPLAVAAFVTVLVLTVSACGGNGASRSSANTSIVLGHSMGGVVLAETRADVERHLGRGIIVHVEDQKAPEPTLHIEEVQYNNGLEVSYVSRNATRASRLRGLVSGMLTYSPRFRTPQGIHVGSSARDLLAMKGVRCEGLGIDCQYGALAHNKPGTMFRLDGPGGVVTRIVIAYAD